MIILNSLTSISQMMHGIGVMPDELVEESSASVYKKVYKIEGPPEKLKGVKYEKDMYGRMFKEMSEQEMKDLIKKGLRVKEFVMVP